MAVQFLQDPQTNLGAILAQTLGTGLEFGAGVIQKKRQKRESEQALASLGFSPEQAKRLAALGPQAVGQVVQQQQKEQQKRISLQELGKAYSQMLGISPQEGSVLASAPESMQKSIVSDLMERGQTGMFDPQKLMKTPSDAIQTASDISQVKQQTAPERPEKLDATDIMNNIDTAIDTSLAETFKEQDVKAPSNISGLLGRGLSKDEAKQAIKETSDFYKDLKVKAQAAKDDDLRLKRMEKLIEKNIASGGTLLRAPARQILLDNALSLKGLGGALGGVLGAVLGPAGAMAGGVAGGALGAGIPTFFEAYERGTATKETQEFEKLSKDFLKGAKAIFGSRLTNFDVESFLQMIPTLAQTDEGKVAVIRNLRLVNAGRTVKKKIADKIIRANGGRKPYNLDQLVDQASDPIIQNLAEEFVSGGEAQMPEKEAQTTDKYSQLAGNIPPEIFKQHQEAIRSLIL